MIVFGLMEIIVCVLGLFEFHYTRC